MKVYRPKKDSIWVDPDFHLIEKHWWGEGKEWHETMMVLRMHTWCGKDMSASKKGCKFEEYQKAIHRKKLCPECVKAIKLYKRMNEKKAQQNSNTSSQVSASGLPSSDGTLENNLSPNVPAQESLAFTTRD